MEIIKTRFFNEVPENFTGIVEWPNGAKYYYVDGILHRTDGPAIKLVSGTKLYWIDGKQHRIDGPAIEYPNGTKEYFVDGKRHRTDGPACEWLNGTKSYYINDKQVTKEAQELLYNLMKLKGLVEEEE